MKKLVVMFLTILLGLGFSFSPTSVKAESVNSGNFVDVDSSSADLYNSNGDNLGRKVPKNSTWYLGKTISIKNTDYYQIATDEYLSSKDSYTYSNRPEVIKVSSTDGDVPLYDHNFVQLSDVALAPGTSWYSDRVIFTPDGMPFVRVATDEYVGMWYIMQQEFSAKL